jgi:hypothetical protein
VLQNNANPGFESGDRNSEARQEAIKQIERKRKFRVHAAVSTIAMLGLVAVWAIAEYQNAGGWPTDGFSESSGIHHVWNYWIIYPLIAWALFLGARAWFVYGRKPISENDIRREMERQSR